jgi:hypothetical protein
MARCRVDPTLQRQSVDGFSFALGTYPVESMTPRAGYSVDFEPADGESETGDWEEWPDRYMFDIVITAERVEALLRALVGLFPGRVYPILDVLGQDAYREVDPYIAYELVGLDRFTDAIRRYRDFFFEDGLLGFGLMTEEPFLYVFVDEHKIVTVRAEPEVKEKIERILRAFDLEQVEEPAGADAVSHEHRTVLVTEEGRTDLLNLDEIVEYLRDDWRLTLNIDPETNVDDQGKELGVTAWRCLVRCMAEDVDRPRYAEAMLAADSLREAEELALEAVEELRPEAIAAWDEAIVVQSDRVDEAGLAEIAKSVELKNLTNPLQAGIMWRSWLE